jgi:hypothetical protein
MMRKTRVLYDGELKYKNELKVRVNLGYLKISPGTPHLLATTEIANGYVNLASTTDALQINSDYCSVMITYPPDAGMDIEMITGNISLNRMCPKTLRILLRTGNVKLDLEKLVAKKLAVEVSHGRVAGLLRYTTATASEISIKVDIGMTDIELSLPKRLGLKTTMMEEFVGIVNLPNNTEGHSDLNLNIHAKTGIVKIKRLSMD